MSFYSCSNFPVPEYISLRLPGALFFKCLRLAFLFLSFLALSQALTYPARGDTLVIQGSTTFSSRLLEPYQRVIESMSGVSLKVIPNKSQSGLISLLEDRADLAMISSSLEAELPSLAGKYDPARLALLRAHLVDGTRVAFAVHPSNPVRKASFDTIRKILVGEITSWSALGGPETPIRVVYSRSGGVTQTVQSALLSGGPILAPLQAPMGSGAQAIKVVAQEPAALGLSQMKLTASNGLPDLETEEVIEQQLYFVTLGDPTPRATAVIDTARIIAQRRLATREN